MQLVLTTHIAAMVSVFIARLVAMAVVAIQFVIEFTA
jgi:hypothetical protein